MTLSTMGLSLAADAAIDLRLHTKYSDGRWESEALFDYLCGEQFDLATITGHDRHEDGFVTYDVPLLDQFREQVPIDGLEVYHPRHAPAQTVMYLILTKLLEMLLVWLKCCVVQTAIRLN